MSRRASGLRAWLLQRISAVYLALYLVYFLFAQAGGHGGFQAWRAWLSEAPVLLAMALFFIALAIHAWVGIRDVIIDYIHHVGLRLLFLSGVGVVLLASLLWVTMALTEVA
ncbi:MAG: succinate dehydrogenase, hydrophobic membrane anchor protein [Gammaproteobacteria bacterium]